MLKYFDELQESDESIKVSLQQILEFKDKVIAKMIEMGVTDEQLSAVDNKIIEVAIKNNKNVDDTAWALLQ